MLDAEYLDNDDLGGYNPMRLIETQLQFDRIKERLQNQIDDLKDEISTVSDADDDCGNGIEVGGYDDDDTVNGEWWIFHFAVYCEHGHHGHHPHLYKHHYFFP